jgi:hypothetical protein
MSSASGTLDALDKSGYPDLSDLSGLILDLNLLALSAELILTYPVLAEIQRRALRSALNSTRSSRWGGGLCTICLYSRTQGAVHQDAMRMGPQRERHRALSASATGPSAP